MTRRYRFLVLVLAAAASPASAQSVRVRAREEGTAHAAVGALVTLRDSLDKRFAQALTDAAGSAILSAPNAGTYFLRIDRIGFSGILLGPFQLVAGDTLSVSAVVPNSRVTLPELSVKSGTDASCELASDASEAVARIWGEAQKALTVSELADSTMAVLEVTKYEREVGSVEGTFIADSAHREVVRSSRPFIAADPARLAKTGFRDQHGSGYVYYAPDARVLLSDAFLAQHCFGPAPPSTEPGLVGLAFFPMAKYRKRIDVTGVLWLDRATSELRRLDFQYTNIDKRIASGKEGGRIEFMRLPRGELIVGRWRVRVGFMERGGEVAVIGGEGAGDGAWVVGTVFDSLGACQEFCV